jgi:transposase
MNTLSDYAAMIGLDWADKKHDICLKLPDSDALEFSTLSHKAEAIDAWARALSERFAGQKVAVCLESRKVPILYALLKYPFIVLYPVNPQTLARYRRALSPSRAKDDPTDAHLLLELVQRHAEKFKPWVPDRPEVRALAQLVEIRRTLVADKVRCTNRVIAALKNYYPQVLDWFEDKDTTVFCHFIQRWPTLQAAQRARKDTLYKFFTAHNVRYPKVIERRISTIKEAAVFVTDAGVIEPNRELVLALSAQITLLLEQIAQFDRQIDERFKQLDDAPIFAALPGAGKQLAPRLLVAFGEDRTRFQGADGVSQYVGVAPVTERSGNKHWVHWRYSCSTFLRQTFIEWASASIRFSFWAQAYYQQQRNRGKTHQMAVRALAFKWIRILYRCWMDRKPYDEAAYLLALKEKGSPLVAELGK